MMWAQLGRYGWRKPQVAMSKETNALAEEARDEVMA
jgi:hypothetical protein